VSALVSLQRKRELVDTPVSLNGRPARIVGVQQPFATVATIPQGPAMEWSWEAADRIVREHGGSFQSR